ncbi:MAG: hypothetical protein EPN82_01820 [Bacteroidetes bacterium]|nr:MAG: hypothetical protein EPN82_01820 [Bacteroidota bacterium]
MIIRNLVLITVTLFFLCNVRILKCQEVKIDKQVWMKENLDVDHYRNGDSIPEVKDAKEWEKLTTGAWCYYENKSDNGRIYGKLYNWYAVIDPRGLAPNGWHIPDDSEWKELEISLGMSQSEVDTMHWRGTNQGSKLKESGNIHWEIPNNDASNESGFTALPGGWRNVDGRFFKIGFNGLWWSTSVGCDMHAYYRNLNNSETKIYRANSNPKCGFSVRCIKD